MEYFIMNYFCFFRHGKVSSQEVEFGNLPPFLILTAVFSWGKIQRRLKIPPKKCACLAFDGKNNRY
jgi:hypothetical protein